MRDMLLGIVFLLGTPTLVAAAPEPVKITQARQPAEVKIKRERHLVFPVETTQPLPFTVRGPGKLGVVAYQVWSGSRSRAPSPLRIDIDVDGKNAAAIRMQGKRQTGASLSGSKKSSVSKPEGATVPLGDGEHLILISASGSGAKCVVELLYFPSGSKKAAPVRVEPAETGPQTTSTPGPALASPQPAPPAPQGPRAQVLARIDSGELRFGLVGESRQMAVIDRGEGADQDENRVNLVAVSLDHPLEIVADGPGSLTLRIFTLLGASATSEPPRLTVLENDVLLQGLDLGDKESKRWQVVDAPDLRVSDPREFRLVLAQKRSVFSLQPSESARAGVLVETSFAPEPKSSAVSLALGIGGDDLGLAGGDLAGQTVVTEVAVRETVKVVEVGTGRQSFLGVVVGSRVVAPSSGGPALVGGGLALRLVPFSALRWVSVEVEASVLRQAWQVVAADPRGVGLPLTTSALIIPLRGKILGRRTFGAPWAAAAGVIGGVQYARVGQEAAGVTHTAQAYIPEAGLVVGGERRFGPGWVMLDLEYTATVAADVGNLLRDYRPGGLGVAIRYRVGL